MSLGTSGAVLLAILFLIPGFLLRRFAELSTPYASRQRQNLIEYLALSCLNYLIAAPLILVVIGIFHLDLANFRLDFRHVLFTVIFSLFLPAAVGFYLGKKAQADPVKGLLRRLGISVLHPAPTGWDFAFARRKCYWIRVEFMDGEEIMGVFGDGSIASTEPDERDVFLESICAWNEENGRYEEVEDNQGMWIKGNGIKLISFFPCSRESGVKG